VSLDDLRGRQLALLVQVAGVTDRYYSGPAPDVETIEGTLSGLYPRDYRDVEAVLDMGPEGGSIDDVTGMSTQQAVTVKLLAQGARLSAATVTGNKWTVDPVNTFRRIGPAGAATKTRITATVPHELGPSDVDVVDPAGFGAGDFVHVGLEAMQIGTVSGNTLQNCIRTIGQTRRYRHTYDPTRGWQPYATEQPIFWRGRVAIVRAAPVVGGQRVGSYREIWRGVLDREAELSPDGLTLTLRIAPMTAAMRQKLASGATSGRLVRGWHHFVPRADGADGCQVSCEQMWEAGAALRSQYRRHDADTIELDDNAYITHLSLYDITLPDGHPRRGNLRLAYGNNLTQVHDVTARGLIGGKPHFDVVPNVSPVIGVTEGLAVNALASEFCTLSLVDPTGAGEVVRWPDRLLSVVSGADLTQRAWNLARWQCETWSPITTQGVEGRWANVRLWSNGDSVHEVRLALQEQGEQGPLQVRFGRGRGDENSLCLGWDWRATDAGEWPANKLRTVNTSGLDRASDSDNYEVRGTALAWAQIGDSRLLVDTDTFAGGAPQWMQLTGGDDFGRYATIYALVSASSIALDPDTGAQVGYSLTVDEWFPRYDAFIIDRGTQVEVRPVARFYQETPSTATAVLLVSAVGAGTETALDYLPVGAGLSASDVLASSFEAFPVPEVLADYNARIDPAKTTEENIADVLTLLGASVVQKYALGRQYVALAPLTSADSAEATVIISADDLLADGQVTSAVDGKVVRAYKLSSDYNEADEPQRVTTFIDADAISASGGDAGAQLDIDLRGIVLEGGAGDGAINLLPFVQHLRRRVGLPRVRYQCSISLDTLGANELALGDVVTLSSSSAIAIDGTIGVSQQPCRVMGYERDWLRNRLNLTLSCTGARPSGYAPSLRVASIVSPTIVTVEVNQYTSPTDPRTGDAQTDIASGARVYFSAGDAVRCVKAGQWASATSRSIVSIVGQTVTLDGAHNLAIGDDIEHTRFALVDSGVQKFAYLGRTDGTIEGTDPARDIG
jgi:hypothetical protein